MRVAFYCDPMAERFVDLARSLWVGGVDVEVFDNSKLRSGFGLHVVIGVIARKLVVQLEKRGLPYLFFDKGYTRDWPRWWRVSYGSRQPLAFVARATCPDDRARAAGWIKRVQPWRQVTKDGHILFVGAEPRYHDFHRLPEPTLYAQQIVDGIRAQTMRDIRYRPRPKWKDARPVAGAGFSQGRATIEQDLAGAHVTVTHGSNTCLDALLAGVPSIVLGDGVTRHICSTDLLEVEAPRIPSDEERLQLLSNLAYCQWSIEEIEDGSAWDFIKGELCA